MVDSRVAVVLVVVMVLLLLARAIEGAAVQPESRGVLRVVIASLLWWLGSSVVIGTVAWQLEERPGRLGIESIPLKQYAFLSAVVLVLPFAAVSAFASAKERRDRPLRRESAETPTRAE